MSATGIDLASRRMLESALREANATPDPGRRWTLLCLLAECHRRAAAMIEAEAAKIRLPPTARPQ